MIHHTWLEGITVQGETLAIRAAEEADSQARQEAAAVNTRGSSGARGDSSASPSGSRARVSGAARAAQVLGEREGGGASLNRDKGKRASVGIVPTKEDEADALKPVHSGESSPLQHSSSPPPPQTTLSMAPDPSRDRRQPREQTPRKSPRPKSKPGSKSKSKTKTQPQSQQPQLQTTTAAMTEPVTNIDGSVAQTPSGQPPQPSQRLVPLAS